MFAISSPTLVDRVADLERLQAAWRAVVDGRPRLVLLAGEAGIGKSRLLREFAAEVVATGGRSMTGACMQLGEVPLAFLPVAEIVRRLARSGDPAALAALDPARTELAALVPSLADGPPGSRQSRGARGEPDKPAEPAEPGDPGDDLATADLSGPAARSRLFEAILGLVARLTDDRPLLLAVEDVHWCDGATRDLLTFLVHNIEAERLLLVLTLRTDGLSRSSPATPWLAELARAGASERIDLERLAETDVALQVEAITGRQPDEAHLRALWRRSEGNPYFVEELLAAGESPSEQRTADRDAVPVPIVGVLLGRVAAVPPDVARVVDVVALAGTPVDEVIVERALGMAAADLRAAIRLAIDAGLLRADEAGRVAPRHALLSEAIETALLAGERRELHEALARAFEESPAPGGEAGASVAAARARHWLAADRPEEAFAASLDAASAASAVYAHAAASRHLLDALDVDRRRAQPLDRADRAALLMRAADTLDTAGDEAAALRATTEALETVDAVADPATAGLIHGRLGYLRWVEGAGEEALAEHRTAVELVPSEPPTAERAQVLAAFGGALMGMGRYAESRDVALEAVRIAQAADATIQESRARNVLGSDLVALGDAEAGLSELRESRRLAGLAGTLDLLVVAHYNLALNLLLADQRDEAVVEALAGRDLAKRLGLERRYAPYLVAVGVDALFRSGRWDEAVALADETLSAVSGSRSVLYLVTVRARLHAGRGESSAAAARLADAARLAGDDPDPDLAAYVALAEGEAAMLAGRYTIAVEAAQAGLRALEGSEDAGSELALLAVSAEATAELAADAVARRDPALARELAAGADELATRALELARRSRTPTARALAARADAEAARAGGVGDADRWWTAVVSAEAAGLLQPAAAARFRYAETVLTARGPREPAEAALRAAHEVATRLGARPLLERVLELARRARVEVETETPPPDNLATAAPPPSRPVTTLSERELEVLRLVAIGRSNGQIADELFITRKTASTHVTHILDKLGVSGRLEAAMLASRLGLLPHDDQRPED